eukprot:188742_1
MKIAKRADDVPKWFAYLFVGSVAAGAVLGLGFGVSLHNFNAESAYIDYGGHRLSYVGQVKNGKRHGNGTTTTSVSGNYNAGRYKDGLFKFGKQVMELADDEP